MEDSFKVPVIFQDHETQFKAEMVIYGYTHRFHVDIEGITVIYEPDEERKYRAMMDNDSLKEGLKLNRELVRLVGEKIQELFGR